MRNKNYPLYELEEFKTLNEMVYRKAEKLGNSVAFQYIQKKRGVNVTYKQFLDDILKVGKFFHGKYGFGKHIAILGENSYLWLVTFMASVMSGNLAVLLDKELDVQDLEMLLTCSDSEVCVCAEGYWDIAEELSKGDVKTDFISMKTIREIMENSSVDETIIAAWDAQMNSQQKAAIFFTSGTSGQSKGVMLSQANMMADINMACKNFVLEGMVLAVLPFHHAFGLLTAVLKPFNYEHTVFINSSLKTVKRDMLCAKPQTMMLVPLFVETFYKSIWQTAKEQGQEKALRKGMLISKILLAIGIDIRDRLFKAVLENFGGNLKYIICGGAALPVKYVQEFRLFGIEILNGYGITECSPVIAVNRNYYHRDGSVGQILKGCQVRISEEYGDGVGGEILVKGANVMLGYYNNPLETETAFSDGWFKTGDLGYLDKDGFLYITGRKKNLIILPNGENVSPEELEEKVMQFSYVKEVIVSEKDGLIQAEVYLDQETEPNAEQRIKEDMASLNKTLPNYKKIVKTVVREQEFEKTTTKKIKRNN